jgi:sulfur-oxidizing protein SoxA
MRLEVAVIKTLAHPAVVLQHIRAFNALLIATFASLCALALTPASAAWAQAIDQKSQTEQAIAKYREMLQDANPADLYVLKGQALWSKPRGPKNASLNACDLGLGPGVVQGAWVKLPRYFADTGKVQDLESRLLTCMQAIQGFDAQALMMEDFSSEERQNLTLLAVYVASESQDMAFDVKPEHPDEKKMFLLGQSLFFMRAGSHDFSCATCHSQTAKRIRLQDLPNLTNSSGAAYYATWPAYRVSTGSVWTMQQRLADCFRQQRLPRPIFTSSATVALSMYMATLASGTQAQAPGLKR